MTPKKNRANSRNIKEIFSKGKSTSSSVFVFKYLMANREAKISIIAPKNLAKTAVERNRLRRKGYLALGAELASFPAGILGALVFKKKEEDVAVLQKEIKSISARLN